MKKLRVILPAILTLAVSTSAAVTGTVAWFTASRLKTIQMNNITAVNPEEGLNLVSITDRNNVIVTNINESTGVIIDKAVTPVVKQATYNDSGEKSGYFRDASVDVASGKVYRAKLSEDGDRVVGYAEQNIATADTKTYNEKKIFYATSFTATFNIAREDSGYEQHLFLDFNQSTITTPDAGTKDEKNEEIYDGLRIGFKAGTVWFVWAPFSEVTADGTKGTGKAMYVSAEGDVSASWTLEENGQTAYAADKFVKAHDDPATTNTELNDSTTLLDKTTVCVVDNAGDYGHLGKLTTAGVAVTVYTWFEGLEPKVTSDNFTDAITGLETDLKFIMRRTTTA